MGQAKNTILIVDDVELNRDVLSIMFSQRHEIEFAESGPEALDILRKKKEGICAILPEFDSYFWAKARPALSLSPKNFYRQCSLNVALYDIIKSISVLEGDNASARFNRFG